nr:glutathione S-transferase T3-like [Tanacetum cinerariifolium]
MEVQNKLNSSNLDPNKLGSNNLVISVKTGIHEVHVDDRAWFEVELQGAQGNRKTEVFQVSNDDDAVAQRQLEDNQLEEKKNTDSLVKEQEKVHLGINVEAHYGNRSTWSRGCRGRSQENQIKKGGNVEDEPVAAGRWLPVEEELLATCYVAVSEDNNVGRRVLNEFNSKKIQKRTKDMLTSKWHTLNANCQKFNAAYKRAKRLGKSGENDVDVLKRTQIDLTGDVPGATQEDLFGHDARPRPVGKPRLAKKTKSDATASTDGSSASTQFGELMEQELRLKREAVERAFEAQAEKDSTLMRLEELRFLATSTKC